MVLLIDQLVIIITDEIAFFLHPVDYLLVPLFYILLKYVATFKLDVLM